MFPFAEHLFGLKIAIVIPYEMAEASWTSFCKPLGYKWWMMLALENVLPEIVKYKRMNILGSGHSITKYGVEDIYDDSSFYVVLNHFDAIRGLDEIDEAPILFFAHDYHSEQFNPVIEKNETKTHLSRDNVYAFLHKPE